MLVFSVFFGRLAGMGSDGIPYPLFSFAALVPWSFFATGLSLSSNSLLSSANLLRKVYFPRLMLPIASILAGTIDLGIAFAGTRRDDVLVRLRCSRAPFCASRPARPRDHDQSWRGSLAIRVERAVPRRALCHPLPRARSGCWPRRSPTLQASSRIAGVRSTGSIPWSVLWKASAGRFSARARHQDP